MIDLNNLKQAERDKIAEEICSHIEASLSAKGSLPQRWKRNEDLYYVVPGVTSLNVVENLEAYTIPLWRQKCDRIVGSVYSSITSVSPYVQAIEEGPDGQNEEDIERSLMAMADAGGFDQAFSYSLLVAANTNIGVMRVRPKVDASGRVTGTETDWMHPKDVVCFPMYFGDFASAQTVGHRFYELLYRVNARMKSGEYYTEKLSGGDDPKEDDAYTYRSDKTQTDEAPTPVSAMVQLYEVITELDLEGTGEYEKYVATVAYSQRKLLKIQSYPYPEPWYVEVRMTNSGRQIWPNDSPAQAVQGLGLAYSDAFTTMIQGSLIAAFPPVAMTSGSLPSKSKQYGPAQIIEVAADTKIQPIQITFNAGQLGPCMEKLEQIADAVTGINQIGTGDNLPASTSATAVSGLLQAQQEAKDQYTENISPSVQRAFGLLYTYLRLHYQDLKAAMGDAIAVQDYSQIEGKHCRLEVTGKSGASNPQVLLQKLQMLQQMAIEPTSTLDPAKIEERIAQALDLPFSVQGLKKDENTEVLMLVQLLQSQGIDPAQVLQLGMAAMEQPPEEEPEIQGPDIPYDKAPPSVRQQMEQQRGYEPGKAAEYKAMEPKKGAA